MKKIDEIADSSDIFKRQKNLLTYKEDTWSALKIFEGKVVNTFVEKKNRTQHSGRKPKKEAPFYVHRNLRIIWQNYCVSQKNITIVQSSIVDARNINIAN